MDSGLQITVGNRPNDFHSYPDNWQLCTLGEITISSQYGISSSSGGNYSVPILKMNNLQDGHIDLRDLGYIQLSKAEMESLMLNKGDLLINRTNSPDLVGKAAIYDLAGEHVFASYLVRFRLGPSVLPAFVNYFLNSEPGQHKLKLLATKAVSQANINPSILKRRLFVPVPPLCEQTAIAAVLSDIDSLIESLDRLIAKKRDIKQATMQQLLTGKTRLSGFSGEWEVKKLGERCEFYSGGTPSTSNSSFYGGSIGWITSSDLNKGRIKEVEGRITNLGFEKSSAKMVKKGTLLLALYGATAGVAAITEIDAAINQAVLAIISQKDNSEFLFQKLTFLKDWLITTYTQGGQPNLSGQIVKFIEFSLPLKPEQTAIATILSDMDSEIAALEQKRDKTRALKHGMMQELLTGKTRLL